MPVDVLQQRLDGLARTGIELDELDAHAGRMRLGRQFPEPHHARDAANHGSASIDFAL
jgi:hypothetical protein